MTQHSVRIYGASICKVSERWSCKDVDGGRHHPSLVWQGRLLPLTGKRRHSIKLDGNLEPKLSHVLASDKMNSLNNESSWDLCTTARWAPSLVKHGLLISDKSHWLTPSLWMWHLFTLVCSALPGNAVSPVKPVLLWICRSGWEGLVAKKTRPWKKYLDSCDREIPLLCFHLQTFQLFPSRGKVEQYNTHLLLC